MPDQFKCDKCDKAFETAYARGNHQKLHRTVFANIKRDSTRKKHLIIERGHRCEVCFNISWNEQPIPLELDHISGDADDNEKSNLRLICPNCHAQTATYKSKNTASPSRRKRYILNCLRSSMD